MGRQVICAYTYFESTSLHLINSSWNMSNKSVSKWWNNIKVHSSVYRSMKVTGKDTFRHTQTNPPDLLVCLHLVCVLSVDLSLYFNYYVLPPLHSSTGFCFYDKLRALQSFTGAIRILTYQNLSLKHTDTYTFLYFILGWSGAIYNAWNVIHSKKFIKWVLIDELKAGRQNWERGVNWRCLDWITVLKALVFYFQRTHLFTKMWRSKEKRGKEWEQTNPDNCFLAGNLWPFVGQ